MFSSTFLKLIALVFMLIDHIGEFIPGIPVYFRWIGRISAPLFLFCMVWGLHYTRNRKVYLKRMYICGVLMGIMDLVLNNLFVEQYRFLFNNIFVSLFLVGVICTILDIRKENKERGNKLLGYLVLAQVIGTALCIILQRFISLKGISDAIGAFTGNMFFSEGGFLYVLMGLLMYYHKEDKKDIAITYGICCIVTFVICAFSCHDLSGLFFKQYQWMMIGALPFMYFYNHQKGKGLKYLFYTFYPAHICILYLLGNAFFYHWFN